MIHLQQCNKHKGDSSRLSLSEKNGRERRKESCERCKRCRGLRRRKGERDVRSGRESRRGGTSNERIVEIEVKGEEKKGGVVWIVSKASLLMHLLFATTATQEKKENEHDMAVITTTMSDTIASEAVAQAKIPRASDGVTGVGNTNIIILHGMRRSVNIAGDQALDKAL